MATYDEYYEESRKKGLTEAARLKAERDAADDETLSQIGRAIDKAADTAAGVYQKNIDGADAAYRSQYADSAVQEAFTRRQIKNSMAASGMTDSGQNLTMQTAIGLQRGNRDATITADKREYVQKMQSAIDQVRADAETQKQQQELSTRQATRDWYDNLLAGVETAAQDSAAKRYAADQELEAENAKQQFEYEKWLAEQEQKSRDTAIDLASKRAEYVQNLLSNSGHTIGSEEYAALEKSAWKDAYSVYPASGSNGYSNSEMSIYNAAGGGEAGDLAVAQNAVAVAASFVDGLNLNTALIATKGFWNEGGITQAIAGAITDATSNNRQYMGMSSTQKSAALSMLAAKMVKSTVPSKSRSSEPPETLKSVCDKLGINYADAAEAYKLF